jgi:hypothetical protein
MLSPDFDTARYRRAGTIDKIKAHTIFLEKACM